MRLTFSFIGEYVNRVWRITIFVLMNTWFCNTLVSCMVYLCTSYWVCRI